MMDLAEELDSLDQLQALVTAYPKIKLSEFSFSRKKVISRAFPYALSVLINQKFSISPRFKSRMQIFVVLEILVHQNGMLVQMWFLCQVWV